jgi:hypothetical protein
MWDRVVVDRVGADGILVEVLDHHPPADRIRESFAVARANEGMVFIVMVSAHWTRILVQCDMNTSLFLAVKAAMRFASGSSC